MPRELSAHTKSTLSETIDHRTKLYSIVAAAAGVSMLALAQPAEGEVVITKKNIPIPVSSYFGGQQYLVPISLTNDGITDFSFSLYSFAYHSFFQDLAVWPVEGGAVVAAQNGNALSYASALVRGARIGPSAHFSSKLRANIEIARGQNFSSHYSRKLFGNWGGNPANRYLGVRFLINGTTHYGWIRLTVSTQPAGFSATITGYAYETVANKKIFAGIPEGSTSTPAEPKEESLGRPSLGMLALGAEGLASWRRDETLVH